MSQTSKPHIIRDNSKTFYKFSEVQIFLNQFLLWHTSSVSCYAHFEHCVSFTLGRPILFSRTSNVWTLYLTAAPCKLNKEIFSKPKPGKNLKSMFRHQFSWSYFAMNSSVLFYIIHILFMSLPDLYTFLSRDVLCLFQKLSSQYSIQFLFLLLLLFCFMLCFLIKGRQYWIIITVNQY